MLPRISHYYLRIPSFHRLYSQAATAAAVTNQSSASQPQQEIPHNQQQSQKCIREQLRELLRETAQPVAVITAFMPPSSPYKTGQPSMSANALHHGATLSSFTSIAMDPYPLVTFALRIPSRMATTLNSAATSASSPPTTEVPAQMVINVLSSTQAKHALTFSRPDLYPMPFTDPDITYTLSKEGLPVLEGSLGAMSCRLVGRGLPLHDMDRVSGREAELGGSNSYWGEETGRAFDSRLEERGYVTSKKGAVASELFIAQVTRVEALASTPMMPLLYHRRKFTSCIPSPPDSLS
ncbi:hypothetical protein D9756_002702 [Leucocoprinus leucothites]|uniref:Flavin reductase like domain-containing protein n=1 Tax=Leucocoprinus leucothites TaxID=201217 RepID=A0A8H5LLX7_9AGAR|nr:hypothetical protein D9756_002702 [Leucoagaricus leucothites]